MRADDWSIVEPSARGRDSVRISSKNAYNESIFVLDLAHMPAGCATWPAFWSLSQQGPWPNGGEIDIIEGMLLLLSPFWVTHARTLPCRCQFATVKSSHVAYYSRMRNAPRCTSSAADWVGSSFRVHARTLNHLSVLIPTGLPSVPTATPLTTSTRVVVSPSTIVALPTVQLST